MHAYRAMNSLMMFDLSLLYSNDKSNIIKEFIALIAFINQ